MWTFLILLAIVAFIAFWGVGIYNGLVTARNAFKNAFAQIDVQLQRRFDLIPNLGATIAGFILVPTILAEEGLTDALIMLAVILVYQQLENNLLGPTIYGKAVNISAFFVILGVTLFGALLGVLGALVAVPVTASLQIVAQEVTRARREGIAEARAALESPSGDPPDAAPAT